MATLPTAYRGESRADYPATYGDDTGNFFPGMCMVKENGEIQAAPPVGVTATHAIFSFRFPAQTGPIT